MAIPKMIVHSLEPAIAAIASAIQEKMVRVTMMISVDFLIMIRPPYDYFLMIRYRKNVYTLLQNDSAYFIKFFFKIC